MAFYQSRTPEWSPVGRAVSLGLRLSLPERPCCREVMLREDLRLSLPEQPCCREVMLREDLRLSLPERPCCREVMLQVAEEPWQKLWIEVERRFIIPVDLIWHESKFDQKRVQKSNHPNQKVSDTPERHLSKKGLARDAGPSSVLRCEGAGIYSPKKNLGTGPPPESTLKTARLHMQVLWGV